MGMFQLTRLVEGIANEVPDNPVVGIFCAALPKLLSGAAILRWKVARIDRVENCESPSVRWTVGGDG
jgi:hypothetical protein